MNVAFLLSVQLRDDGTVYALHAGECVRMIRHMPRQRETTVIVRALRGKPVNNIPGDIRVLYDRAAPQEVLSEDYPSSTQAIYHSWLLADPLPGRFDCAVVFDAMSPWALATAQKRLSARRRVVYVCRDPRLYLLKADIPAFDALYRGFDAVLCSGTQVQSSMRALFDLPCAVAAPPPEEERYRSLAAAAEPPPFEPGMLNLVTVEHLRVGNHAERVPELAAAVKGRYPNLRWYILGEGERLARLQYAVILRDVCGEVLPMGREDNPCGYIAQCTALVNFESDTADWAVGAGVLGVPVISLGESDGAERLAAQLEAIQTGKQKSHGSGWSDQIKWERAIDGAAVDGAWCEGELYATETNCHPDFRGQKALPSGHHRRRYPAG